MSARAQIAYDKVTREKVTREVTTLDDLIHALLEIGYGQPVEFEIELDGHWYRVKALADGETTGLRLAERAAS